MLFFLPKIKLFTRISAIPIIGCICLICTLFLFKQSTMKELSPLAKKYKEAFEGKMIVFDMDG